MATDPPLDLRGVILPGVDLRGANLQGADLLQVDLRGAHLEGVQLQNAQLNEAQLQGALLKGAYLQHAQWFRLSCKQRTLAMLRCKGLTSWTPTLPRLCLAPNYKEQSCISLI